MTFGSNASRELLDNINIVFGNKRIETVSTYNYLGVKLDQKLKFDLHAKAVIQKVSDKLTYLRRIRRFINNKAALSIYKNMILPILEYGDVLLLSARSTYKTKLQTLQNKALKCALGLDPLTGLDQVHERAKLETLENRRKLHILQLMHKQLGGSFLCKRKKRRKSGVVTRSAKKKLFSTRQVKTEKFKKSITNKAPLLWNARPVEIQNIPDRSTFQRELLKHIKGENQVNQANT